MRFRMDLVKLKYLLFLGFLFSFSYSYSLDCPGYLLDQTSRGESVFKQRMLSKENFAAMIKDGQENFYKGPHWAPLDLQTNRLNAVKTLVQYILNFGLPDMSYVDGDWQDIDYLNLKRLLVLEDSNFGERYVLAQASWIGDLESLVSKMLDDKGYLTAYSYSWGMDVSYQTTLRITPSGRVLELQEGLK